MMPQNETQTPENTNPEQTQDTQEQSQSPESDSEPTPVKAKGKKSSLILPDSEQQAEEELPEIEYPSLVYICPGQHSAKGATFDYVAVENDEELKKQLDAGYSVTLPEAIKKLNG